MSSAVAWIAVRARKETIAKFNVVLMEFMPVVP